MLGKQLKHLVSTAHPKLSVIVASHNGRGSVVKCLQTLESQRDKGVDEIIVVDNSTDGSGEIIKRDFPGVKFFAAKTQLLIPELWSIGIGSSTGEIVALTTSHFIPASTWAAAIIKAHATGDAGIGGAIENEVRASLISWAVYFCRYTPYMLPFQNIKVEDFAADNASYKRLELEKVKYAMRDGFWETFVHKEMRREGMSLAKSPEIVVYHQDSFGFLAFMNQRFWHGRQYAISRIKELGALKRFILLMLSPLIPAVYIARIIRRIVQKKRNVGRLAMSFPILMMFLLSWSMGEFTGYLWNRQK